VHAHYDARLCAQLRDDVSMAEAAGESRCALLAGRARSTFSGEP
jgi:hypothetical protein